jgi:hypothetical protein
MPRNKESGTFFNRCVENSRFNPGKMAISMRYLDRQILIEIEGGNANDGGTKGYQRRRILWVRKVLSFRGFPESSAHRLSTGFEPAADG